MTFKLTPELSDRINRMRAQHESTRVAFASLSNEELLTAAQHWREHCVAPTQHEENGPTYDATMWHAIMPELVDRLTRLSSPEHRGVGFVAIVAAGRVEPLLRVLSDPEPRRWRHRETGVVFSEAGRPSICIPSELPIRDCVVDGDELVLMEDADGGKFAVSEGDMDAFEEVES